MPKSYTCEKCLYNTHIKFHWVRHLATKKHIKNEQQTEPLVTMDKQRTEPLVTMDEQRTEPLVTMDDLLKEIHLLKMENAGLRFTVAGWVEHYLLKN
jgi:hypothetical protein